jgi:hypothetical protein
MRLNLWRVLVRVTAQLNFWQNLILFAVLFFILFFPFRRMRWADAACMVCGLLLVLAMAGNGVECYLRGYWHFNAHLVLVPVIGPDGRHVDGTPASDAERWNSQLGIAGDVWAWSMYPIMAGGFAFCCYMIRLDRQMHQQRRQSEAELARFMQERRHSLDDGAETQ